MIITIKRTYFPDATLSWLSIESRIDPVFPTIERPWLDNKNKISCIPEGEYDLIPYTSPHHPSVWEIANVVNRDQVLLHEANWALELEGCIAPGLSFGYMMKDGKLQKAVKDSLSAMKQLKDILGYPSSHKLRIIS